MRCAVGWLPSPKIVPWKYWDHNERQWFRKPDQDYLSRQGNGQTRDEGLCLLQVLASPLP